MEGPSLYLAAEQLQPFVNKEIKDVSGNTKIGKERLNGKVILDIFSCGKQTVNGQKVTGDYPKKNRVPRLALSFENGSIEMYSCSLRYIESSDVKSSYDFSIDIMSPFLDKKKAFDAIQSLPDTQIGDILLDQSIFAGVGNIIKNEVLYLVKKSPERTPKELSLTKLKEIVKTNRDYVFKFYEWRKQFVLRKHYQIYRQSICPRCQQKVNRRRTGKWKRFRFICSKCQK